MSFKNVIGAYKSLYKFICEKVIEYSEAQLMLWHSTAWLQARNGCSKCHRYPYYHETMNLY